MADINQKGGPGYGYKQKFEIQYPINTEQKEWWSRGFDAAKNSQTCKGEHRFFVADVATVQGEGKVVIIAMCTSCGEIKTSEVVVTNKKEKQNNND